MELFKRAKTITEICAVSGREHVAFEELKERFGHMFDEIFTTPTGSFVGIRRCGKPNAKSILFDAHLDEIGFMVKKICDGGFLKVSGIGGTDTKVLSAAEVWIHGKEKIAGVFASTPPHLRESDDNEKLFLNDMYIDTGMSKEYLEENTPIGTVVTYKTTTEKLLNGHIVGKSMDDKISMCTILEAFDLLDGEDLNVDIIAQFSGGEEIGYIGATTAAFKAAPDYAVAIDVTNSYIPEAPIRKMGNKLGGGGVISYSGTTSRPFTKHFIEVLNKENIPHQIVGEPGRTGTNAHVLQIARDGIPTALISVPLKNMHTQAETATLGDLENIAKALAALAKSL
ncbi:MAG: M20/M25/M40 family metallo-hydrolase [Clostridia bacterium]|nr:M20/M25/M40 family metallo-hydrolase [Clostridia bacterium]MBQ7047327.1 M20/M25/M40 family metallo-hydrolase [Clostridia bacterium]